MNKFFLLSTLILAAVTGKAQDLTLNDLGYFERQGVNVLVFSNSFNGGFNDEKNSGIEIIQHGVRAIQGGAVRLNNTPEQWDLVPKMTSRNVNREQGSIEVGMRYDDYDFDSRVVVTAHGKSVEVPGFQATTRFDQGVRRCVEYLLAHPELQVEDPAFDAWCDRVIEAQEKAKKCFD